MSQNYSQYFIGVYRYVLVTNYLKFDFNTYRNTAEVHEREEYHFASITDTF